MAQGPQAPGFPGNTEHMSQGATALTIQGLPELSSRGKAGLRLPHLLA